MQDYGPGVCLIQGAYLFRDAEGRPLRYKLDENGNALKDADDNPLLDPEGQGPVHEVEYVGTGFLVDRRGLVLTNRHVAEPWWNDEHAQSLAERGFTPKQTVLRAFFPKEKRPFELTRGEPRRARGRLARALRPHGACACPRCRSTAAARAR